MTTTRIVQNWFQIFRENILLKNSKSNEPNVATLCTLFLALDASHAHGMICKTSYHSDGFDIKLHLKLRSMKVLSRTNRLG